MSLNTIEAVVRRDYDRPFDRLHATPLSAHLNCLNQTFAYSKIHCSGLAAKIIAIPISFAISCVAVAETVASFAYTIFATLLHTMMFFESPSFQNHVVKLWAFAKHSALMIAAPYWFLTVEEVGLSSTSRDRFTLEKDFMRLNCNHATQSIGKLFDHLADRLKGSDERKIEAALEVFPRAINLLDNIEWLRHVNPHQIAPIELYDLLLYSQDIFRLRDRNPETFDRLKNDLKSAFTSSNYDNVKKVAFRVFQHKYAMQNHLNYLELLNPPPRPIVHEPVDEPNNQNHNRVVRRQEPQETVAEMFERIYREVERRELENPRRPLITRRLSV